MIQKDKRHIQSLLHQKKYFRQIQSGEMVGRLKLIIENLSLLREERGPDPSPGLFVYVPTSQSSQTADEIAPAVVSNIFILAQYKWFLC